MFRPMKARMLRTVVDRSGYGEAKSGTTYDVVEVDAHTVTLHVPSSKKKTPQGEVVPKEFVVMRPDVELL